MRIISKEKDYYDSALAFGHDDRVTYVRNTEEYVGNSIPEEYIFMSSRMGGHAYGSLRNDKKDIDYFVGPSTVAFCGVVYRAVMVVEYKYDPLRYGKYPNTNFFYDMDSVVDFLSKKDLSLKDPKEDPKFLNKKYPRIHDHYNHRLIEVDGLKNYFASPETRKHLNFFVEKKLPAAAYIPSVQRPGLFGSSIWNNEYAESILILNPILNGFNFYRRFDPYTAFQELEMFLGGILAGEDNPMAGISDKDLLRGKGFDCYSFKTPPTKRKPKKCR